MPDTLASEPTVFGATPRGRLSIAYAAGVHGRGLPLGDVSIVADRTYDGPDAGGGIPDGIAYSRLRLVRYHGIDVRCA